MVGIAQKIRRFVIPLSCTPHVHLPNLYSLGQGSDKLGDEHAEMVIGFGSNRVQHVEPVQQGSELT